jgi:arginase family enzyme
MESILKSFEENPSIEHVFLSFDVDSINSAWCPGVSAPSIVGGLTNIEALSIMERAKISSKVKLVDFSEFNPAVECERTANLISDMIISFIS